MAYQIYSWAVGRNLDNVFVAQGNVDKGAKEKNCDAVMSQVMRENKGQGATPIDYDYKGLRVGVVKDAASDAVFLVCADGNYPSQSMRQLMQAFMDKMIAIHGEGTIQHATDGSLTRKSEKQIGDLMRSYKDPEHMSLVEKNKRIIKDTKDVLGENINQAISRANDIDDMDCTAQELNQASSTFRDKSREVRNAAYWQMVKMYVGGALLVLVVIGVLVIVIMASTGGFSSDSSRRLL